MTGETLTRWRRLVWRYRRKLYAEEFTAKQNRMMEEAKLRSMRNG